MSMATSSRTLLPPTVSNVVVGQHSVRFSVSEIGKPVLVRVSWYPNWKVRGGDGPYRVSPNFMVVIPNKTSVTLDYRYTQIEALAVGVTILGLIAVVLGWRSSRRRTRRRRSAGTAAGSDASSATASSATGSRGDGGPTGPPQVNLEALALESTSRLSP